MLFRDILNTKTTEIQNEFDLLFKNIINRQTHDGDLLLIRVNGFYNSEVHKWTNFEKKMSPYMIGPNMEGYSDHLHYQFIHNYRIGAISEYTHSEYLEMLKWSRERNHEVDNLTDNEAITIQLEMLIYLKMWESDLFIKKLYQLTLLSHGEPYDWHFSIAESNRDKGASGTRESLIRKHIRDRLKNDYPNIYHAIRTAYKTQIRNSIAHSKYAFFGRRIQLTNYTQQDKASQISSLSFDEWIEMFHYTMVLYNQLIRFFIAVDSMYAEVVSKKNLLMEVRITRTVPEKKTEYHLLKYRPEWNNWHWNSNDK